LTIGIPTWNRCVYLTKNIEALIAQIQQSDIESMVEILVSDNASTDETKAYLTSLTAQHSYVTYHRSDTNKGANANFQFVVEAAKGKYVWLLGDDDLLVDDVIKKVMCDLQINMPDVAVGAAIFDESQEKATHKAYHERVVGNRDLLAHDDVIALAGKMSGLILKKDSVMPMIAEAAPIISATQTPWPHLAWFLLLLNDPTKSLMVLPYGINQLVAANWYNLLFSGKILLQILFIDYQALLLALKSSLEPEFYAMLIARSVSTRQSSLLKCILYATYLDEYGAFLRFACSSWKGVVGKINKINYTIFLILPALVPRAFRKFVYQLAMKRWKKLHVTITRLERAHDIATNKEEVGGRQFDAKQL
tara:strand:- start:1361 stop:2449 length:1089 start_codon:yes stop_codon:yes gene_type:complete